MSWIERKDIHMCDLPEFVMEEIHNVGELWRCDESWCGRVWRLAHTQVNPGRSEFGDRTWSGRYRFEVLDMEDFHHWNRREG